MKRIFYILSFAAAFHGMNAQDVQFTQFSANMPYLNPALTGSAPHHRFTAAYRNQWPGIKKSYTTYLATYDNNIDNKNSGFGVVIGQDMAGTTGYSSTFGSVNYSYKIKTGFSSGIRMGLSAGGGQKKNDFTKLVLNDQFITGSSVSEDVAATNTRNYVDIGTGIAYTSNHFWIGYAAKHLNQPSTNILGGNDRTPVYHTAHMGYRIVLRPNDTADARPLSSLSFLMNYRHEKTYDQFDLGAVYMVKGVSVGIWYRGLPMKRVLVNNNGNECVAFMLGYTIPGKDIRFAYSYDLTVSSLTNKNTTGAHEITLGFEFGKKGPIVYKAGKKGIIKKKF